MVLTATEKIVEVGRLMGAVKIPDAEVKYPRVE
jgi:hypothetical protein